MSARGAAAIALALVTAGSTAACGRSDLGDEGAVDWQVGSGGATGSPEGGSVSTPPTQFGGSGEGSCTPAWYRCTTREDCCSGMCVLNVCWDCRGPGESCQSDGHCCSNFCLPEGRCSCSIWGGALGVCKTDSDCCYTTCDPETSICRPQ